MRFEIRVVTSIMKLTVGDRVVTSSFRVEAPGFHIRFRFALVQVVGGWARRFVCPKAAGGISAMELDDEVGREIYSEVHELGDEHDSLPELIPLNLESDDFCFVDLIQSEPNHLSHGHEPLPDECGAEVESLREESFVQSIDSQSAGSQSVLPGAEWNLMIAGAFAQYRNPNESLKLPWETGAMGSVFKPSISPVLPGANALVENSEVRGSAVDRVEQTSSVDLSVRLDACYMEAITCTQDLDYFTSKRIATEKACGIWLDLIACNWTATKVGAQICSDLRGDPSGESAIETLKACFGTKSPNTLLKRASSLKRFFKWHSGHCRERDVHIEPIPLVEEDVWKYFHYLRADRVAEGRGYTTPGSFLETVRFTKFTVGLKGSEDVLESGRLIGFAALERREKGPTRQAPPMEVEHLRRLHDILASDANLTDRLGAGTFLVCIYARARWSDIRFIHHVEIEAKRNGCFVIYTTEHKTSQVGLRREQYLPLVVPWDDVVHMDWLKIYFELYKQAGLNISNVPLGPLLPAPKIGGGFGARPLSTPEASAWLKLLLRGTTNSETFRSHSLKGTLLSWCARSGMDREVRAVLGHHCSFLTGSDVVYARELQTRPIRKLQMLLKNIRLGMSLRTSQSMAH